MRAAGGGRGTLGRGRRASSGRSEKGEGTNTGQAGACSSSARHCTWWGGGSEETCAAEVPRCRGCGVESLSEDEQRNEPSGPR